MIFKVVLVLYLFIFYIFFLLEYLKQTEKEQFILHFYCWYL